MKKNNKAFTILELLVVVVIVAVLAVIAVPSFIGAIEKSRDSREIAEVNSVTKAASMFYMERGYYPTLQGEQPTFGDPKNLKFSTDENGDGLYPTYLSSLPHFSYWYIDYEGVAYHTEDKLEDLITLGQYDTGDGYYIPFEMRSGENKRKCPAIIVGKFTGTKVNPESPSSKKPTAVINMNPAQDITTSTNIVWSSNGSSSQIGTTIVNEQWEGKQDKYTVAGEYTIRLRVQDSNGLWSDWVSKKINVGNPPKLVAPAGLGAMTDGNLGTGYKLGKNAEHYITWEGSITGKTIAFNVSTSGNDSRTWGVIFLDASGNGVLADCSTELTRSAQFDLGGRSQTSKEFRISVPEGVASIKMYGSYSTIYEVYIVEESIPQVSNVSSTVTDHSATIKYDIPSEENFSEVLIFDNEKLIASSTTNTVTVNPLYPDLSHEWRIYSVSSSGTMSAPYRYSFNTSANAARIAWRGISPALFDGDTVNGTMVKGSAYVTWDGDITGRTIRIKISPPAETWGDGVSFGFVDQTDANISTYCKSENREDTAFRVDNKEPAKDFDVVVPAGATKLKITGYGSTAGWGLVYEVSALD